MGIERRALRRQTGSRGGSLLAERVATGAPYTVLLGLCLALISTVAGYFYTQAMFLALGAMLLVAVVWPLRNARSNRDLVSPWSFIVATVVIGGPIRGAYIALGLGDQSEVGRLVLLGEEGGYFLYPGALMVVAVALMAAAFFSEHASRVGRGRLSLRLSARALEGRNVHVVAILCGAVGVAGFLLFAQETGGLDLLEPSRKRAVLTGLKPEPGFRGLGGLRLMSMVASVGYLTLLAYYATTKRRISSGCVLLLAALFVAACLLPFYSSSRDEIMWLVLQSGALLALAGRAVRGRHVLVGIVTLLIITYTMGALRATGEIGEAAAAMEGPAEAVESVILSRNFIDVARTAHVINAVPEKLEYAGGSTIARWVYAPIPRSLWADKPVVQPGPEVGAQVYGNAAAGVPPGFVGEMYWNFHVAGVLVGSAVFGLVLRIVDQKLGPGGSHDAVAMLLYVAVVLPLGVSALGGSVGEAMFDALVSMILVLVVVWMCTVRPARYAPVSGRTYAGLS